MRIGEVAKRAGISVPAIRYYERLGLLSEAERGGSGYRQFDRDALRRLAFIRRAQGLGFSLPEIRQLLELRQRPDASAADVRAQVESKLATVESKLGELRRLHDALNSLKDACCCADAATSDCPILDALEDGASATSTRKTN